MAAVVALRGDYDAASLRALAKQSKDADQTRRLMSLAVVYAGGSRGEGAAAGGVGLQTFRDWVLRFNAAGRAGLLNGKAPGPGTAARRGPAAGTGASQTPAPAPQATRQSTRFVSS